MRKLFLLFLICLSLVLIIYLKGVLVKDDQSNSKTFLRTDIIAQIDQSLASSTESRKIPDSFTLKVPFIAQKYRLSCEAASLQMALAYKGVEVSQDELIEKIGVSLPEVRSSDASGSIIWGDPNEGFVGDVRGFMYHRIRGTISATGWGVNKGPIAEIARSFLPDSFAVSGKSIEDIVAEISAGNPVIVWQHSGLSEKLDTLPFYKTLSGATIRFTPSHVNVIVGFRKDPDGSYIFLVNDPEYGKIEVEQKKFEDSWMKYSRDMVVVR